MAIQYKQNVRVKQVNSIPTIFQLHSLAIFTRTRLEMVPQGVTRYSGIFLDCFHLWWGRTRGRTCRISNKKAEQSVNFICGIWVPSGTNDMLRKLRVLACFRGMYWTILISPYSHCRVGERQIGIHQRAVHAQLHFCGGYACGFDAPWLQQDCQSCKKLFWRCLTHICQTLPYSWSTRSIIFGLNNDQPRPHASFVIPSRIICGPVDEYFHTIADHLHFQTVFHCPVDTVSLGPSIFPFLQPLVLLFAAIPDYCV